jgi:hypothetical protein
MEYWFLQLHISKSHAWFIRHVSTYLLCSVLTGQNPSGAGCSTDLNATTLFFAKQIRVMSRSNQISIDQISIQKGTQYEQASHHIFFKENTWCAQKAEVEAKPVYDVPVWGVNETLQGSETLVLCIEEVGSYRDRQD